MAYMSQKKKKELTPAIQKVLSDFGMKGTLSVRHHSALVITLSSGPLDLNPTGKEYVTINEYCIDQNFEGQEGKFLNALKAAMMVGNHNNSDSMTDYFDVGWYISIVVGRDGRPYDFTGSQEPVAGVEA